MLGDAPGPDCVDPSFWCTCSLERDVFLRKLREIEGFGKRCVGACVYAGARVGVLAAWHSHVHAFRDSTSDSLVARGTYSSFLIYFCVARSSWGGDFGETDREMQERVASILYQEEFPFVLEGDREGVQDAP